MVKKWTKRESSTTERLELAVLLKTGSIYNNALMLFEQITNTIDCLSIKNRTF